MEDLTFEQCLREEFLMNTHNYPAEYHQLFWKKYNAAKKRFDESESTIKISQTDVDKLLELFDKNIKKRRKKTGVAYLNRTEMKNMLRESLEASLKNAHEETSKEVQQQSKNKFVVELKNTLTEVLM